MSGPLSDRCSLTDMPGDGVGQRTDRSVGLGCSEGQGQRPGDGDVARAAGLSRDEIDALLSELGWLTIDFDSLELDTIQLVTDLLTMRGVAGCFLARIHSALGAEGTVALLMVIDRWSGLALMLNALDVDIDDNARVSIPSDRRG